MAQIDQILINELYSILFNGLAVMELTIKNKTCLLTAFFDRGFIFVHKFAHQTQFMECKDSFITVFIEVFQPIIPFVLNVNYWNFCTQ